jgi:hypothetical protein
MTKAKVLAASGACRSVLGDRAMRWQGIRRTAAKGLQRPGWGYRQWGGGHRDRAHPWGGGRARSAGVGRGVVGGIGVEPRTVDAQLQFKGGCLIPPTANALNIFLICTARRLARSKLKPIKLKMITLN